MAKRDFVQAGIKITSSSSTGSYHIISDYLDTIGGFQIEALTQETHAAGDSYVESAWTGVKRIPDITLGGFFDDVAASGPRALLGGVNVGGERNIKYYVATADSYKVDVLIASYQDSPVRNELTRFESVLRPTGAYVTST